ncbi:hypothetical protein [Acinetobacter sp. 1125_18A]|uniref:hypothetical protein n=1 Tax=Acinetobacter sp. 1125_18A TaxID=2605959 RepID=UPI004059403B
MFFDNEMCERLLAFARNIAALLFIGGIALVIAYRAETKVGLETHQYLMLFSSGIIMFIWSLYLAVCNVTVLYHDYRNYLLRCLDKNNAQHNLDDKQLKSTSQIIKALVKNNWLNKVIYYFQAIIILFIGFSFVLIYVFGVIGNLEQQAKLFGF